MVPEAARAGGLGQAQVLDQLGKKSGLVIATGGGCVTRDENYQHLHQNSKIVWLQRDLEHLPTDGRPLSQQNKLTDMYRIREPLYKTFSDIIVSNNHTATQAAADILLQMNWEVSP